MSLFISDAMAAGGAGAAEPGFGSLIPLILIFVIFYFLLLRPQMKRAKEHKKMTESLAKGDEVVTTGGLLGRISKLDEEEAQSTLQMLREMEMLAEEMPELDEGMVQ